MSTTFVTENNKYVLLTSDATNPLFAKYTGCDTPEELGELYVIAYKSSYNPAAIAIVKKNGFSIYTEDEKIDIIATTTGDREFNPGTILSTFAAGIIKN